MPRILRTLPLLAALLWITGCGTVRKGGELHLRHSVTILTPEGPRTFTSVVRLDALQNYNFGFGGSGWGGVSCRLTGDAVHAVVGDRDYYFLLARPGDTTPAWTQIGLLKTHFGLPHAPRDGSWVAVWQELKQSDRGVDLAPNDYPAIAVMPHDGWMDDARLVSRTEAQTQGLRILRYRIEITRDPVGSDPPANIRYRPPEKPGGPIEIGRELFSVVNGTA